MGGYSVTVFSVTPKTRYTRQSSEEATVDFAQYLAVLWASALTGFVIWLPFRKTVLFHIYKQLSPIKPGQLYRIKPRSIRFTMYRNVVVKPVKYLGKNPYSNKWDYWELERMIPILEEHRIGSSHLIPIKGQEDLILYRDHRYNLLTELMILDNSKY